VLEALLWTFHNAKSGLCFPSYVRIAEAAGCCEATAKKAVKALERCGLLTWVNRLRRVRECVDGLFGAAAGRTRVVRTSNGYRFNDPKPRQAPKSRAFSSRALSEHADSIKDSI
jgi:Helix-turn-helix domain